MERKYLGILLSFYARAALLRHNYAATDRPVVG